MNRKLCSWLIAILCFITSAFPVLALEAGSGETVLLNTSDIPDSEGLTGICILSLPDESTGTLLLGNRVLRAGDILTASQLETVSFRSISTSDDLTASMTYLPVYENSVAPETTMVFSIHGKVNQCPIAEDDGLETYKNLTLTGKLKVSDPENEVLTYTVIRAPRRGELVINADGSFLYTPKKNKVGTDSFIYTATDAAGNVSREATVTIRVIRPTDSRQYTDAADCSFYAEWMKNTGIFTGEEVGGQLCFCPDAEVSKGQFLVMTVKALNLPVEDYDVYSAFAGDYPDWISGYMPAAIRCGLFSTLPTLPLEEISYPITGAEAAVILQNVLQLPAQEDLQQVDGINTAEDDPMAWAQDALSAMAENGMDLSGDILTRAQAAKLLYQASRISDTAPGIRRFR